jgi:hypothetical protein
MSYVAQLKHAARSVAVSQFLTRQFDQFESLVLGLINLYD